ncbi:MAG: cytochrome c [Nitrospirota bacterium]
MKTLTGVAAIIFLMFSGVSLSAGAQKGADAKIVVKKDKKSIEQGKALYDKLCIGCHDPKSARGDMAPGHKGILKNPTLPVSKRPATPENVVRQLRDPFSDMPSFAHLKDEQVQDLLAYLNTL